MTSPARSQMSNNDEPDELDELDEIFADLHHHAEERDAARDAREIFQLLDTLRATRKVLGLSQTVVAERMGTTQSAVSVLEGGDSDPQLSTVMRYARALGLRLPLRARVSECAAEAKAADWAQHVKQADMGRPAPRVRGRLAAMPPATRRWSHTA